jgi:hypothetical protein
MLVINDAMSEKEITKSREENKDNRIKELKKVFLDEFSKLDDINQLKELYATELAKRDKIIFELQNENKILLKAAFKNKKFE